MWHRTSPYNAKGLCAARVVPYGNVRFRMAPYGTVRDCTASYEKALYELDSSQVMHEKINFFKSRFTSEACLIAEGTTMRSDEVERAWLEI